MHILNIHAPNDIRLDETNAPAPSENDVVVRIKACGVCGSDITFIKAGGLGKYGTLPMPLGHEAAGEVCFAGKNVPGIHVGQRVTINPQTRTSTIGNGGPEGAFTEELLVRDAELGKTIIPIPDDLPYDLAALTEPLGVALHAVNRADPRPGEKAVVYGCGPIGLGVILWLADRGVSDIVAIDLAEERLERARTLGATATIRGDAADLPGQLMKLHGQEEVMFRPVAGTHIYFDAAGGPNILSQVTNMARKHARLIVIAAYTKPLTFSFSPVLTSEMSITASMGYPTELPDVVAALPRLREKAASLISHRFPYDQIMDAIRLAGTAGSAKVMVEFGA